MDNQAQLLQYLSLLCPICKQAKLFQHPQLDMFKPTSYIRGTTMITLNELLSNNDITSIPETHRNNLEELLIKMNALRKAYGKPMVVTSGYRSYIQHQNIYKQIAFKRGVPFYLTQVPMKSKHLSGQAVDIADPDFKLHAWCRANVELLEELGLWCEELDKTPRVHFQSVPPTSGRRFFKP